MKTFELKYGKGRQSFELEGENILQVIEPNPCEEQKLAQKEIVEAALMSPITSPRLGDMTQPGQTVCVVIPDMTRAWQMPHIYVPAVIAELKRGGVADEDILIISATGSHRAQTEDEHRRLVGDDVYSRIKVIDHVCTDEKNLVYMGRTTANTPVWLNRKAMACDHLVLTGGVVYHFLAGFGGGPKSVLPGISGYDTIMTNHTLSFNTGLGSGKNHMASSGILDGNPIYEDMLEAVAMARPTFNLNVVAGKNGIAFAAAGNLIKSHRACADYVNATDRVAIREQADLVVATAGGFPKDMNLYQTSKTMFNAIAAAKKGGAIIIASQCAEGFGSEDTGYILTKLESTLEREKDVRGDYTIGKDIAYLMSLYGDEYTLIMVTDMDARMFARTNIKAAKTISQALDMVYEIKGSRNLKTHIMPSGANTLPHM